MSDDAKAKIQAEMDGAPNNTYVQIIGQFLLRHLNEHPEHAALILAQDKTILKSLDAMRDEASKHKVGNVAVLSDQEGFSVVLNYFGIKSKSKEPTAPVKAASAFDVKLDDYL